MFLGGYIFVYLFAGGLVLLVGLLYSGDCVVIVWLGLLVHTISGIACSCGLCVVVVRFSGWC